jgi:hypothetical protein
MVMPIRVQNIEVQSINTLIRVQNIEVYSHSLNQYLPSDSRILRKSHSNFYPLRCHPLGHCHALQSPEYRGTVNQYPHRSLEYRGAANQCPSQSPEYRRYSHWLNQSHSSESRISKYSSHSVFPIQSDGQLLGLGHTPIRVQNMKYSLSVDLKQRSISGTWSNPPEPKISRYGHSTCTQWDRIRVTPIRIQNIEVQSFTLSI